MEITTTYTPAIGGCKYPKIPVADIAPGISRGIAPGIAPDITPDKCSFFFFPSIFFQK